MSAVSLIGLATLSMAEARVRRLSSVLVSFAVGALLGDAFIHLIPAAFARDEADGADGADGAALAPSLRILAGILLFFVVEKLLRHRHGPLHRRAHPEHEVRLELATINLIGDAIHNFLDGVLIGVGFMTSPAVGIATTIAVFFHEIPQELGDFGVLVHSGLRVRRAVVLNLLSAAVAIVGTVMALTVGALAGAAVTDALVPVAAGGFVYIAAADLIPELQHDRSLHAAWAQGSLIAAGIGVMALLALLE